MVRYCSTTLCYYLGHISKIVSILLSKLRDCLHTDTLLCYYNYPFLKVYMFKICLVLISFVRFIFLVALTLRVSYQFILYVVILTVSVL